MIADTMRLYFMLRHACLSRGKMLERVFQLWQELRVFLAPQGYPMSTNFQGNFWLSLNLNSVSWIVKLFPYEETDFSGHRKRQDMAPEVQQGGAIPWRGVTMRAPNGCRGAKKSQLCHKYFLKYRTYASERPQFWIWEHQTASYPGRHLTLLRPCTAHITTKLMKVNLLAHEVCTTLSMEKKKSSHLLWLLSLNLIRQLWHMWF